MSDLRNIILFSRICVGIALIGALVAGGCADSAPESGATTDSGTGAIKTPKPTATVPPNVQVGPPKQ